MVGGDLMKIKELENIIIKPISSLMKQEGQDAFNEGLVIKIEGKKIDNIYHIYGKVNNKSKSNEFNTHIKISLQKKMLLGTKCTCDDFEELSNNGYTFMCSHLAATAYRFLSILSKNELKEDKADDDENSNVKDTSNIRLIRKVLKDLNYYEVVTGAGLEKVKINAEDLGAYLKGINSNKIKFKYEFLEFTAPILQKDLPITFTIKERNGNMVLTTQLQFPISLNNNNDVFLFKNKLYLPSKEQILKYIPIYEKLKLTGEIKYKKSSENYNKLILLLSGITKDIIISEELRNYMSNFLKPEFLIYEEKNNIYCDIKVIYDNERINILKDKNNAMQIRNYKKEEKILLEAEKYKFVKQEDKLLFIGNDRDLLDIINKRPNSIHSIGNVVLGNIIKDTKVYGASLIEVSLNEKESYLEFSYSLKGIEKTEFNNIYEAYKLNRKIYRTKNRGFIDFEDGDLSYFFNLLETLSLGGDIKTGMLQIEKNKALYLMEKIKDRGITFVRGSEILKRIEDKLTSINDTVYVLPEKLLGVLRDYQISGFKWFKTISELGFGGILADEMGLGKTIQSIAFILSEEYKKSIIICPTSLIYNWKDEFEKFAPSLRVAVIHGERLDRLKIIEDLDKYDVLLTTYGTLKMDVKYYENIIFDYCFIDEGQNIKNSLSLNTKVVKEIRAKNRFALTGTPIENNLVELWSIFDFIMPHYLYSREVFEKKFIYGKEENLENLKILIKPFILRRTKKEVISELPDKIEKKFLVEMTSDQKAVYTTYLNYVREKLKNSTEDKIEVFSYLTRLRQICLDPTLVLDEYAGGSGKLKIAQAIIEEHIEAKGKVLLFSQFTSVLNKIGKNLKEANIEYFYLDGTTKSQERIKMVNEFNDNDCIKVFLISLKAGGTGLNLTAANLVVHFDPWWNPAVENQATDRAHRIGQSNVVEVIKLVAKGTIEEKIILLQEDKKELIGNIITGELQNSNLINRLSREELIQLFDRD
jgi:SNF2 family DNA or RNA helicase